MKIEKAIEILTYHEPSLTYDESPDIRLAIKLGIEALKFYKRLEDAVGEPYQYLLPGETKN